eukprot:GFUD01004926.1.p1 GENE.GFUD01004926.1~~GFUD01004926.1.p1  ORF type:complete len:214 (+),score=52.64 GFUD01004926.1:391-1032(+)
MRNGGMGAENLVKEATELLEIADLSSSAFSWSSTSSLEVQLDRSSYNGVCQQVVELKILLLQLRRLLDWTNAGISQDGSTANTTHIVDENELLRERLKDLQREVIEKDERIKRLEKILETGKKDVSQAPQSRPHSLQDVSIQSRTPPEYGQYKPCHHAWGPCANDHTHHHARRGHKVRRFQARSLSGGRQSRRRESPLGIINGFSEERSKGLQ